MMPDLLGGVIPQVNIPQLMAGMNTAFQIIIVFGFLAIFVTVGWKKKLFHRYPTKFFVYRVMGGTLGEVKQDSGRRVVKRKHGKITDFYYDVRKANFKWIPPSYEFMQKLGKGAVVHVREISHNNWEAFDPAKLVKGEALEYRSAEKNELDDYFKNTQDDMAEIKLTKEKDKWAKIFEWAGPAIFVLLVGIAVAVAAGPLGELYATTAAQAKPVLDQSTIALERSNTLFDAALRFCSSSPSCLQALGITNTAANGTVVIP